MAANQLDVVTQLAQLLGGTSTKTSAGDTSALQSALSQLQANTDGTALLQSIFQKAAGEIPGLQTAFANSIGARSGDNSAVTAALSKLLSQTTLSGQSQLATQTQNNLNSQVQAGQAIAQATKGTTQTNKTNLGGAAKNLAILQLLSKSGLLKGLGMGGDTEAPNAGNGASIGGNSGANVPTTGGAGAVDFSLGSAAPNSIESAFASDLFSPDATSGNSGGWLDSLVPSVNVEFPGLNDVDLGNVDYANTPATDYSFTPDYSLPTAGYESDLTVAPEDWQFNFADGGLVVRKAAGGRRSEANEVQTNAPGTTGAVNSGSFGAKSMGVLTPTDGGIKKALSELLSGSATGATGSATNTGTPSNSAGVAAGSGVPNKSASPSMQNALNTARTLNALSALTGGPSLPGSLTGAIAGLAKAKTNEEALGVVGKTALSVAAPQVTAALSFAQDPSLKTATNIAASLNPATAAINAVLGLAGTSAGQLASNTQQNYQLGQTVNPDAGLLTSLSTGYGINNSADPLGALNEAMGWTDSAAGPAKPDATFGSNNSGGGGNYGFGSSYGGSQAGAGDTDGSTSNGNTAAAMGGEMKGPGTGTSDSIHAKLSAGETVVTAKTTEGLKKLLGDKVFLELEKAFNPKAAEAQVRMGRA